MSSHRWPSASVSPHLYKVLSVHMYDTNYCSTSSLFPESHLKLSPTYVNHQQSNRLVKVEARVWLWTKLQWKSYSVELLCYCVNPLEYVIHKTLFQPVSLIETFHMETSWEKPAEHADVGLSRTDLHRLSKNNTQEPAEIKSLYLQYEQTVS